MFFSYFNNITDGLSKERGRVVRTLRCFLLFAAVAAFVSFGGYGCAKKQVKAEEGVQTQQPAAAPSTQEEQAKPEVAQAPAGPKEAAAPAPEAVKPETELEAIHFDFDKYDIRPGDAEILQKNASWIKDHKGSVISIEGNCDERGTVEYNLALGERRAKAAQNYLISLGVDKGTLKTISYGKSKPVDPGHNEEAWAKNRRDDFVVVSGQ